MLYLVFEIRYLDKSTLLDMQDKAAGRPVETKLSVSCRSLLYNHVLMTAVSD